MAIEIKVPVLPESVSDATVAAWHKQVGDAVERGENIVDLETDKVVLEVPSPVDGVITEIKEAEGATVVTDQVIASIEEGAAPEKGDAGSVEAKPESQPESKPSAESKPEPASASSTDAGPSARRVAAEHDVPVNEVKGTGKDNRVTRDDVNAFLQGSGLAHNARPEKRVPMTRMRAKIAERLLQAQQNAAILTTFNEINLKALMDVRAKYKESFEKKHGVRLGLMSFFTRAVVEALKLFPSVNASIDGDDIVYHGYYDVGIAVSTDRGLVVPVIRNAENMSMATIEATIADFGTRARSNQITMDDMKGGTFTITNGGRFGSLLSTPIINPPQTGILGMHTIQQRPVAENGEVVIRPMMYVALSYDHRLIDGQESVQFLVTVKQLLEDPVRLLLDI